MPYGAELARVNLIWTPKSPDWAGEQAICGFWVRHEHFTGNDFDWDQELGYLASNTAGKLVDHWGDLAGEFGSGYWISEVTAAQIGTDGTEINKKTTSLTSSDLAGAGTAVLPPEVALCVSLYGYIPGTFAAHRGRRRSRMYLPYLNAAMADNSGKVASLDTVQAHWTSFFNDIQGMHIHESPVPPGGSSDYWSLSAASSIDGSVTQIERVGVDNHFDSQRRRQHQTPATVSLGNLVHS